jgi:hypothetical protein
MEHPLHPYAYEARYQDGRRLRWDSPGGPWGEARLPCEGLTQLVVLAPGQAILLEMPGGPIQAIRLRARGVFTLPRAHTRRYCFGVVHADGRLSAICIDERGSITRYLGDPEAW